MNAVMTYIQKTNGNLHTEPGVLFSNFKTTQLLKELNKWYQSMPTGQNRHAHTPQQPMYQREYFTCRDLFYLFFISFSHSNSSN